MLPQVRNVRPGASSLDAAKDLAREPWPQGRLRPLLSCSVCELQSPSLRAVAAMARDLASIKQMLAGHLSSASSLLDQELSAIHVTITAHGREINEISDNIESAGQK
eukprot:4899548-Pyramimonas_sp.AAC.1